MRCPSPPLLGVVVAAVSFVLLVSPSLLFSFLDFVLPNPDSAPSKAPECLFLLPFLEPASSLSSPSLTLPLPPPSAASMFLESPRQFHEAQARLRRGISFGSLCRYTTLSAYSMFVSRSTSSMCASKESLSLVSISSEALGLRMAAAASVWQAKTTWSKTPALLLLLPNNSYLCCWLLPLLLLFLPPDPPIFFMDTMGVESRICFSPRIS
mmetsp:Transcript_2858/g.5788  ORF Transcript_2858/g.5788 Transcript_2858/m.5788 type:complete len:210 (-) Transcript_2858:997-1626(-)